MTEAAESVRVDFYVLESAGGDSRLQFACRLAEKAYALDNAVYAHTDSDATARRLDELLWTFRQGSFVPHELLGATEPRAAVRIGTETHVQESGELLVNLADEVPTFTQHYARIAEIIDASPTAKRLGREKFRRYRELGLEPETHRIN